MSHPFTIVDVFTDVALAGNQLAVFTEGHLVPEALLQAVAREMGFSETVFALPGDRIRIFTPARELPFAGHPVIGTAALLTATRRTDAVTLHTGMGPVEVTRAPSGRCRMAQPLPVLVPLASHVAALLDALGVDASVIPVESYENGPRHTYVVVGSVDEVAAVHPNFDRLVELSPDAGVSVLAGSGTAWRTRCFFPGAGVPEDPATGSAAGPLAVHLARHGLIQWGDEITISQGSEMRRPSTLYAVARGGPDAPTAVDVAGDSVIVATGQLTLDPGLAAPE